MPQTNIEHLLKLAERLHETLLGAKLADVFTITLTIATNAARAAGITRERFDKAVDDIWRNAEEKGPFQ